MSQNTGVFTNEHIPIKHPVQRLLNIKSAINSRNRVNTRIQQQLVSYNQHPIAKLERFPSLLECYVRPVSLGMQQYYSRQNSK